MFETLKVFTSTLRLGQRVIFYDNLQSMIESRREFASLSGVLDEKWLIYISRSDKEEEVSLLNLSLKTPRFWDYRESAFVQ